MKGIILAGGTGSRLYPLTKAVNKHLLPVYNKPMIYYPLSILMLADIKEICIIVRQQDLNSFKNLLNDGSHLGIKITYLIQEKAEGIAQAFLIAEDFIGNDEVCLILGDNIFYGHDFAKKIRQSIKSFNGCISVCTQVKNPSEFGIIEFSKDFSSVISIEEKPKIPKSNYAALGLYFFDNTVIEKSKVIKPSSRNELEIIDILKLYSQDNALTCEIFGRGFVWLDTGTHESLFNASSFVQTIEERQGYRVACLEEIAYRRKFITKADLIELSNLESYKLDKKYFMDILDEK